MNTKYKIFSDMDGVLVDFDKAFIQLSEGITPKEYDDTFGRKAFWDLVDNVGGVEFWSNIPWMKDGKEYWDYIKPYNPKLLSSPSINNVSRIGKQKWVDINLPGTKLYFSYSKNKYRYSFKNRILIDDKDYIINSWNEAGGIGILHTSAQDTIKQLKELGI